MGCLARLVGSWLIGKVLGRVTRRRNGRQGTG